MTPTFGRTAFFGAVVSLLFAIGAAAQAQAQNDPAARYPSKPVRLIVGFGAGGGNDIFARLIAQKLQERTGWTVVVENKPGAGGRLSADFVAAQAPDGYTVLVGASGAMAIGPLIFKTKYVTLTSFTLVTMIGDFPLFLVIGADHPAKTVTELVAWTKANPDKANYATSSPAFTLPTELFKLRTGARGVGIPFKSGNEMLLGVISGNAAMAIVDPPPTIAQVQGGKLRALAVTAKERSRELPDVPTMAEAGVADVNVGLWSGFFVPAGTPKAIVDKLGKEMRAVIRNTDVGGKLKAMAVNPSGNESAEFAKHIAREQAMWAGVLKAANLKLGNK